MMFAACANLHQPHPDLAYSFHALLRDNVSLLRQLVTITGNAPCVPAPLPLTDGWIRDAIELNDAQIEASKPKDTP